MSPKIGLRIAGFVLVVAAIGLWRSGFDPIPLSLWGIAVLFPIHYVVGVLGLVLMLAPTFPLYAAAFLLPPERGNKLLSVLDRHFPVGEERTPVADKDGSVAVVDWVQRQLRANNRRYYLTAGTFAIIILLLVPLAVSGLMARRAFSTASRSISRLVQEQPLAFSAADDVRRRLVENEGAIRESQQYSTATGAMHEVLAQLYAPDVTTDSEFVERLSEVYLKYVDKRSATGTSSLLDVTAPCRTSEEPAFACQSYLTLLSSVATSQGKSGEYFKPYLRAKQLATAALGLSGSVGSVPAAHNILGLCYKNFAQFYPEYQQAVQNAAALRTGGTKTPGFDDPLPLNELTLLRRADDSFNEAAKSTANNFNEARYLNNSADLRIILIARSLLEGAEPKAEDAADREFLVGVTGRTGDKAPSATQLAKNLSDLDAKLTRASTLSRQPQIYFTRAQLRSLGSELASKGLLTGTAWSNSATLRKASRDDLATARALGLSRQLFSRSRAASLRLSWMWKDRETATFLDQLIAQEERSTSAGPTNRK